MHPCSCSHFILKSSIVIMGPLYCLVLSCKILSSVFPFFHSPQFTSASNRRAITTPLTAVSKSSMERRGFRICFYRMTKSCLVRTRPFTSVIRVPALFHTQAPTTATSPAGPTDSPTCHKTPIGRSPHFPACIWHVYGVTQRRVQCLFPGAW